MNRMLNQPILVLFAAAALGGTLLARGASQDPPKERPKVAKTEKLKEPAKERAPAAEAPKAQAPKAAAPAANPREVAKQAAHFESVYRDRIARIDRLIEIYKQKGDREKVTKLEALRDSQMKRHANAMEGFRKQIGDEKFGQLEKEMRGRREKARETRETASEGQPGARSAHEKTDKPKEDAPKKERPKEAPGRKPGGQH